MDKTDEIVEVILMGILVANFLLNTRRVLRAIELCKECLVLFDNEAVEKQTEVVKSTYKAICCIMLRGYERINDHAMGIECCRRLLNVFRWCGERVHESRVTFCMAKFYGKQSKYKEAKELYKKVLSIMLETGKRETVAACYFNLGFAYRVLGKYGKAEECHKKALFITIETGDKEGEASCYMALGNFYLFVSEYGKAEKCQKKALVICKEIGDQRGEASCYGNLGTVYQCLCEYGRAEEYQKKALVIKKDIGDRHGEATCYGNLGTVYESLGQYAKAEEYLKKALVIEKEMKNRMEEATCYGNLGKVYESLGEYGKAEEYYKKALLIKKEIGDRGGEASCCVFLGSVYYHLKEHGKAEEYQNKALLIRKGLGDRKGEAACYSNLGNVYSILAKYDKAEEHQKKALEIVKEFGDKKEEATCYANLARLFHERALALSREIGDINAEYDLHFDLAFDLLKEGNADLRHKVLMNLFASIQKCEEMRSLLTDNDQFKIFLLDRYILSYQVLSALLCFKGGPNQGLYAVELGRARALADLMSTQYCVRNQMSSNPKSWKGIERIMDKEINCSCLYISYWASNVFVWVLKANKPVLFRQIDVNECFVTEGSERNVDEVFSEETVKRFNVLPQEHCEDRSLFLSNPNDPARESSQQDSMAASRLVEDEEDKNQQPVPTLSECYQMIIAPVANFLDEPEIIIVPDSFLYKVPFAALKDENDKYLSEIFRIRIVPSLTTLKLIQDSPTNYHSQTGALIVGEPDVNEVLYKGRKEKLCPLPCARREAEMIGRLLGVQPLLGKQATKQAVLQSIHSVSLIHFAAHGNAERGEIALAPQNPNNALPREEDYLLTMADISQVRLRAKLVVLSCCHTACGQIRTEGVVGIARAFLGSGARSVLVALWALGDSATEQLMSHFYEHLVRGDSASESLHQTMKWMRSNGYPEVRDWAPFMLIGDNVMFDFGK